jgi:peptidoglycan/LPS O-acetylase OafA/YrhL
VGYLRLVLAVSVLVGHSGIQSLNHLGFSPESSVEIFFILSGFFVAHSLKTNSNIKSFYLRRAKKIYPGYYAMITILLVSNIFIQKKAWSDFFTASVSTNLYLIFSNLTLVGADFINFLKLDEGQLRFSATNQADNILPYLLLVPPIWSISLELYFYLLAPFICKLKTRYILWIFCFLTVIRITAIYLGINADPWSYRFFIFELCFFFLGVLLYRIKHVVKYKSPNYIINLFIFFFFILFSYLPVQRFFEIIAIIPLILLFGFRVKENRLQSYFGSLSYFIYISHWFVLRKIEFILGARFEDLKTDYNISLLIFEVIACTIFAIVLKYLVSLILTGNKSFKIFSGK